MSGGSLPILPIVVVLVAILAIVIWAVIDRRPH